MVVTVFAANQTDLSRLTVLLILSVHPKISATVMSSKLPQNHGLHMVLKRHSMLVPYLVRLKVASAAKTKVPNINAVLALTQIAK